MIELLGQPHDRTENFLRVSTPSDKRIHSRIPKGIKSRQRIKPVSDKRRNDNKLYEKAKREWRKEREAIDGFKCEFTNLGDRCKRKSDRNPHHAKGRVGKLLYDKVFWKALCRYHHKFIHDNPKIGYDLGLMIKRI